MIEKRRICTIIVAVSIFSASMVLFIALWYFIIFGLPSILSVFPSTNLIPTSGPRETLGVIDNLSVVVMRWGVIPIFTGGFGDLTLYYTGYALLMFCFVTIWVKRRW